MFAFKSDGTSLGARTFSEYSNIRKWIAVDGVLYTAVGNTAGGGSVLRWIGDDIDPFQFEIVGKLDTRDQTLHYTKDAFLSPPGQPRLGNRFQ